MFTFLSLGFFVASVYPDLQSDSKSNTVYIMYSEGFPSGTCCGSSLIYNMTDDTLLLSIPSYEPPTPWNQTLPPLFAYFYVGLPFQITNASCAGGGFASQCDGIFVSHPFKLQNVWWVATNQTWKVTSLYLKLSVSNAVTTDLWGEKSLKFSLGNMNDGFFFNNYQNESYIAKDVFKSSSSPDTLLRGVGRDAYKNPFSTFSIFITQFYFGVIPSSQTKNVSPLPITVLGNGEVIWTVTGTTQDPFYGQDKLYVLSTRNPSRDVFTAFSGIAFGSFLGIILDYHRKTRSRVRATNTPSLQPEFV